MRRLAEVGNDECLAMSDTIRLVLERGLRATKSPRETAIRGHDPTVHSYFVLDRSGSM